MTHHRNHTSTTATLTLDLNKDKSCGYKAGSVIISCKPFAYALGSKFSNIRCDTCFKSEEPTGENNEPHRLLRCGGCHLVRYCDHACQRTGWQDGHKWECKGFKTFKLIPPSFGRLLLRIIAKLNTGYDHYDNVTPKIRRRFKDLVSHYSDIKRDTDRMEQVHIMVKVAETVLAVQNDIRMPNESELVGICGRIFVNTFNILDYEGHVVGTGLYLGASIFDHSCEPMALANFESTTITVRSIGDIPASLSILKITICYKDTLCPSPLRIAALKKAYYFECECERCSTKLWDTEMCAVQCPNISGNCQTEIDLRIHDKCPECKQEFDSEFVSKVTEAEEMAKLRLDEMTDVAFLDVSEACLLVLTKLKFSDTNWLLLNMAAAAFDSCVELQKWEKAYQYGTLALKGYRRYLYKIHPLLGVALLKMAKLSWFLEKEDDAKRFITDAKRVLDVTHGPDHPFVLQNVFPLVREIATCSRHRNGMS